MASEFLDIAIITAEKVGSLLKRNFRKIESQLYKEKGGKLKILGELLSAGFSLRILGIATVSFGWVASGRSDFYAIDDFKLWDVAAGALIVSEAGGKVTDFYGAPWNSYSKNVVTSNWSNARQNT